MNIYPYKWKKLTKWTFWKTLKWYFKLGILHPHWLWILLICAGFLIRRSWFVTCSKFYHQKESFNKNKFHQREYFKGNYLKLVRSRNISFKKFDILPMSVIITPEEVYGTYVEIDKNMLLHVTIYDSLIQKAKM